MFGLSLIHYSNTCIPCWINCCISSYVHSSRHIIWNIFNRFRCTFSLSLWSDCCSRASIITYLKRSCCVCSPCPYCSCRSHPYRYYLLSKYLYCCSVCCSSCTSTCYIFYSRV